MNTPKSNNLPKSLHTITAIVRVARHRLESGTMPSPTHENAVGEAVIILGYGNAADPDGLAVKAIAQLAK